MILQSCRATVGIVSNVEHNLEVSGKAGRSRWLGRRPRTRGVVMNPVDHPMGRLLDTSAAADDPHCVDLVGSRIS